jgi:hypothetical protein
MSTQLTEGVKSTFSEHHAEIKRRATVNESGGFDQSVFDRVDGDAVDDPFCNSEQTFVVFSLSQREFAPIPRDLSNPGVCLYGAFETYEEAVEEAQIVRTEHPSYSVFIDKTHTWIGAYATVARMTDVAYVESKRNMLLDAVKTERETAQAEFEANVSEHRAGKTSQPIDDEPVEIAGADKPDKISRACRVEQQSLAVVSFVQDTTEDAEFLMRVYAFYNDDAEANRYVCNVCGDRVTDVDIDVIKTSIWAFPQTMHGRHVRKEVYRSTELNNVMRAHKKAPQDVERFKSENKEYFTEETASIETTESTISSSELNHGLVV